jgi:hypothetical protein
VWLDHLLFRETGCQAVRGKTQRQARQRTQVGRGQKLNGVSNYDPVRDCGLLAQVVRAHP